MSKKLQQISVPLISVFLGILLGAIVMWIFGYDAIWGYENCSTPPLVVFVESVKFSVPWGH